VVNEKLQVSLDYRRKLRQEIFYCQKYGVKSHLERSGNSAGIPENQYLISLLGRIQYILLVNPEDQWFKEAEQKLLAVLGRKSE